MKYTSKNNTHVYCGNNDPVFSGVASQMTSESSSRGRPQLLKRNLEAKVKL